MNGKMESTPPVHDGRKKRKSRSWVWEHFTLSHADSLDGLGYVQCNHCDGHQGRYKYSGGTSNMSLHLNRKHQLTEDLTQPNTPLSSAPSPPQSQASTPQRTPTSATTADTFFTGVSKRLVKSAIRPKKTQSNSAWNLLLFFIQEALPLRLLQSPHFHGIAPGIALSKPMALKMIDEQYKSCCEAISRLISSDALHLTLALEERCTNGITSVAVTLHWVDRSFAVFRVLILVESFPRGLHISQIMALLSRLYSLLPSLQGRIQVFLASSERLVTLLTNLLPVNTPTSSRSAVVLPSLSHLLEHIVHEGLEEANCLLDKVAAAAAIMCTQAFASESSPPLAPWRQTFHMLQQVVAQSEKDQTFTEILAADKSSIQALINLLQPFETAESMLAVDATYGVVVPVLENLRSLVEKVASDPIVGKVKSALCSALSQALHRDSLPQELGISCAMLDPRFKQMPFLTPSIKQKAREALQVACEAVIVPEILESSPTSPPLDDTKEEVNGSGQLAKAMASFFGLASMDKTKVKHEIDVYLEFPPLPFDAASDPIAWWKANQSSFPRLAKLARDCFSIPASCPPQSFPLDHEVSSHMLSLKSCANYPTIWDIKLLPLYEL